MTFKEYIRYKQSEDTGLRLSAGLYSETEKGDFLHNWTAGIQSIEFFTRFKGFTDFGGESGIKITVNTLKQCTPADCEQPFFWKGPMNEYAADSAVMRAYDIITEGELKDFFQKYRPDVTFSFFDNNHPEQLTVSNDGRGWMVEF